MRLRDMLPAMFGSIVVGTDGSDTASEAVRQATELAAQVGAKIHIVSAYEPVPEGRLRDERQQVPDDLQWMVNPREDVSGLLERSAEEIRQRGIEADIHAREGDPADAILDVAEEQQAGLIVVGNKGMTGAKRFLLGSVPNKVSHHALQRDDHPDDLGRLYHQNRAVRLVRDRVRDAPEHAALHSLVADHEQVGAAFLRQPHQDLGRIALVDSGLAFDPVPAEAPPGCARGPS